MVNEYWGTLSIYDHRDPIFIRSLILFDRILIPIPQRPTGNLTMEEIDRLYGDATYLKKNGAAIIYEWRSEEFPRLASRSNTRVVSGQGKRFAA